MTVDLSIVLCAHDMARELPRTVQTLSPAYQRNLAGVTYEIIVLDHGSPVPVDEQALRALATNLRVIRVEPAPVSPVQAINRLMDEAPGRVKALMIDGARMLSPGVIGLAMQALRADPDRVVGTLAFHLGPDMQARSVFAGYNQAAEDALLATVPWNDDGYRLFDISVLAGSSTGGWFSPIAESNALFMTTDFWRRSGGLDPRFASPGGGFANLEYWSRVVAASNDQPWMLLGEGTFHQVHGGAATNSPPESREAMHAEYLELFGRPYVPPVYQPRLTGQLTAQLAARFGFPNAGVARPDPSPKERAAPRQRLALSAAGRPFAADLPPDSLTAIQGGTLRTRYRGRRLAKNPFDLVLYLQLLQNMRPRSIIEIGTSEGGSALWFADQARALGLDCQVVTLDRAAPATPLPDIRFFTADATDPEGSFPHDVIAGLPRPWLVTEDSAHTHAACSAVLGYFHRLLQPGDRIVIEDGIVADLPGAQYDVYEDGPNRAVAEFLAAHPGAYRIDAELCDFFGHNVTFCPNGWLARL